MSKIKGFDVKSIINSLNTPTTKGETLEEQPNYTESIDSINFDPDAFQEYSITDGYDMSDFQEILDSRGISLSNMNSAMHILFGIGDIESLTISGYDVQLVVNSQAFGKIEISLILQDGRYVVDSATFGDGTVIHYNLTAIQGQFFWTTLDFYEEGGLIALAGLFTSGKVNGYSTIEVNGQQVYIWWIGNNTPISTYLQTINDIKEEVNQYPDNVLDLVFNQNDFIGFFVGSKENAFSLSLRDDENHSAAINWAAYASSMNYIFICHSYGDQVILHELAHIIDFDLSSTLYSSYNNEFISLYTTYNQTFQHAFDSQIGYSSSGNPEGIPNCQEFFAEAVSVYIRYPDELQALFPELYEYIDQAIANA